MIWLRVTLLGCFLMAVIYIQFFFDFSELIKDEAMLDQPSINEAANSQHAGGEKSSQ